MLFTPLRLDGDTWVDWMPPPAHLLFDRFRLLGVKYFYPEYEEQKAMLDKLHERDGTDIFVASYSAVQKDDDSVFSFCVWSKGVDTLLPKAQTVMFFEPEREFVASGDWDRVVEVVGDRMEKTDLYPPRYRVRSFPSDDQLAAIGTIDE